MRKTARIFNVIAAMSLIAVFSGPALAEISGQCSNCHTMHNSQGGDSMAFDGSSGPYSSLTRGTCFGCHGQGTGDNIVTVGGSEIPQVYHTDSTDLAAGNYRYIVTGGDAKGHNVVEIDGVDATLTTPPGWAHSFPEMRDNLACSGKYGCHGLPIAPADGSSMGGSHHQNVDGRCDTADEVSNSYRFLISVKGFENMGTHKYQNLDANNHNEYFGATEPGGASSPCVGCHSMHAPPPTFTVPNNSISGFCGTCHYHYHVLDGIGGSASGPFIRHPSDVVLPVGGEFAGYTAYDVSAPVGRTTVPSSISSTVTPGTDVVTCLSCHMAHASPYDDMLRWDYATMQAGTTGGAAGSGCFACHTEKDGS